MPPTSVPTIAAALIQAPFALFWGPTCVIRSAVESFFWGPQPFAKPRTGCAPMHVYKIACEPPCYRCRPDRCCNG